MEELVKLVADKVGISEEQAQQAVALVMGYMKDNLPEPMAGQIDRVLGGDLSQVDDLVSGLGGLLGKK